MLKVLIILIVLGYLATADDDADVVNFANEAEVNAWINYQAKFNRTYSNITHHTHRRSQFLQRFRRIQEHNQLYEQGQVTWNKSVNHLSDLTAEEFMKFYNGAKNISLANIPTITIPVSRASLPTTWDIRTQGPGKLNAIKDQGQCGSCWAFSSVAALENGYSIKSGQLVSLSEQEFVDCIPDDGCDGGWFTDAFGYSQKNGMALESAYPYTAKAGSCRISKVAHPVKNTGYVNLANDATTIKTYISTKGVCGVCVDASGWQSYSSGIYNGATGTVECNHAVAIIGWGPGYWLIRNSWGTDWGQKGYIQVSTSASGGLMSQYVFCPSF